MRTAIRRFAPALLVLLASGPARAALVATMAISPPGPLVQNQIVTISYTISNTGAAAVPVTFALSGADVVFPTCSAMTFQTFQGSTGTTPFSNPVTIAAGASYTVKWFARADGVTTALVSFSSVSPATTPPTTTTSVRILGYGDAHAADGPAEGHLEVRNNILRIEHRTTAIILLHGAPGGVVALGLYGPSGMQLSKLETVTLDGNGRGTSLFTGFRSVGSTSSVASGLYWIVASGAVADRKPVMILDFPTRKGSKDAY